MREVAIHNKDVMAELIMKGLSLRLHRLIIINEKTLARLRQKDVWMEKKELREIPDILRVQSYSCSVMAVIVTGSG